MFPSGTTASRIRFGPFELDVRSGELREGAVRLKLPTQSIEILTATGTPVFTTRVADTVVTLPADVPITPGVEYRWWVATEFTDGTQRRSEFRRLIIRDTK